MWLADWVKSEHERIARFAEFYCKGNSEQPDMYPLHLPTPGEWDEQYRLWDDLEYPED